MTTTRIGLRAEMRKFLRELNFHKRLSRAQFSPTRIAEIAEYLRFACEYLRFNDLLGAEIAFNNAKGVATERYFR